MAKPEGYPFLRIARQFQMDYGDVLALAESLRRGLPYPGDLLERPGIRAVIDNVKRAHDVQHDIRRGRIDWQTGEAIGGLI